MNEPTHTADKPSELNDAALDDVNGGIIAILIGLAFEPKLAGDGSVRPSPKPISAPAPR